MKMDGLKVNSCNNTIPSQLNSITDCWYKSTKTEHLVTYLKGANIRFLRGFSAKSRKFEPAKYKFCPILSKKLKNT